MTLNGFCPKPQQASHHWTDPNARGVIDLITGFPRRPEHFMETLFTAFILLCLQIGASCMPFSPWLGCKLPKCKDKVQVAMIYPPYTRHRNSHYMTMELRKFFHSFIHSFWWLLPPFVHVTGGGTTNTASLGALYREMGLRLQAYYSPM